MKFITKKHDSNTFKIILTDTAGQERFYSMTTGILKKSDVILLVYDITDKTSFESIVNWLKLIKDNCRDDALKFLIANKVDLNDKNVVNVEESRTFAIENDCEHIEVSAKTGFGMNILEIILKKVNPVIPQMKKNKNSIIYSFPIQHKANQIPIKKKRCFLC